MKTTSNSTTLLKEDEEIDITFDKETFKKPNSKSGKKLGSMDMSSHGNNEDNGPKLQTKLTITKSATVRTLTPRDNVSKSKKRRYVHQRDKSVGSAIPNSIRSYTPALIALIDHTKGLQSSANGALASYGNNGLNRPATARSMRDMGSGQSNKTIHFTSQSPPVPDRNGHIFTGDGGIGNIPMLSNIESNQSVGGNNNNNNNNLHFKQQSGTFLVNEISADQGDNMYDEESTVIHTEHQDHDVGVFTVSPKDKNGHAKRNSISHSATVSQGNAFNFQSQKSSVAPGQGTALMSTETTESNAANVSFNINTGNNNNNDNNNKNNNKNKNDNNNHEAAMQQASMMTEADVAKLIELSNNAGQEYLYLVQINEDLVKERQMLSMRLEDMQNGFNELKKKLVEDKRHRRQNSDMSMQLDSLKSQNIALQTENEMLTETVNDLENQLQISKDNIKKEQLKQVKIMETIANSKRGANKSLDLTNLLSNVADEVSDADVDDADVTDVETAKNKSLLNQALSQLESERQEKSELDNLLNETKRELGNIKKERNEYLLKIENMNKLVETQQTKIDSLQENAKAQFEDLTQQLDEANEFMQANEELAKRMAELQQTNDELENDQARLQSELLDVKRIYQDQLKSHLNESDYTKVALDDEMLTTVGLHMRQISAHWPRVQSSDNGLHMHSRDVSGMSLSHYTENLGDYYYTLGSGFNDTNIAQYTTRAMAAQQFDNEFSQTRNTYDDAMQDDGKPPEPETPKPGKTFKVSVVDEDGQTKADNDTKENKEDKDSKDNKENKENKESKENKENNKESGMTEEEKEEKKKAQERKKKLALKVKEQELQKARAEMEFFFLTCMAVKMNLKEAYPDSTQITRKAEDGTDEEFDLMTENPWDLFKVAQEQQVPMNKFALWTETRFREKYGLGKFRFAEKIKLPNLALEEKFKAAKVVASEQGRKGKEKAQQFGSTVGEAASHAAEKVGERVRRMTVEATEKYQKFRSRANTRDQTGDEKDDGSVPHSQRQSQSMPSSPGNGPVSHNSNLKIGKNGLTVNATSDFENSDEDKDSKTPQNAPILEETASMEKLAKINDEKTDENKNESETAAQTANAISNSENQDNDGKTNTTNANNGNGKPFANCCIVM